MHNVLYLQERIPVHGEKSRRPSTSTRRPTERRMFLQSKARGLMNPG